MAPWVPKESVAGIVALNVGRTALSNCETAVIPAGLPHRFINDFNEPMAMIWVYAGDMPTRKLVDASLCTLGKLDE